MGTCSSLGLPCPARTHIIMCCGCTSYIQAAETLQQEANISLTKFDVADNINLLHIVQEYEEYYEVKFGCKPKLTRRLAKDETEGVSSVCPLSKVALTAYSGIEHIRPSLQIAEQPRDEGEGVGGKGSIHPPIHLPTHPSTYLHQHQPRSLQERAPRQVQST